MSKIIFITGNAHKLAEARAILGADLSSEKLDLEEIQSEDLREISHDKAEKAFTKIGKPLFVEDVALVLDAWGRLPGPFIKYFVENVGASGILKMLGTEKNRRAVAYCALSYHDGKEIRTFVGECRGEIATELRGENGFGFDPIFVPEGQTQSYAEMSPALKNTLSHRGKAYQLFQDFLTK